MTKRLKHDEYQRKKSADKIRNGYGCRRPKVRSKLFGAHGNVNHRNTRAKAEAHTQEIHIESIATSTEGKEKNHKDGRNAVVDEQCFFSALDVIAEKPCAHVAKN